MSLQSAKQLLESELKDERYRDLILALKLL